MICYVYIGTVDKYMTKKMKIGQTTRLIDRARQLGTAFDCFVGCNNLEEGLKVEDALRRFVRSNGGISAWGKDWFEYDEALYQKTREALITGRIHEMVGVPIVNNEHVSVEERAALLDEITRLKLKVEMLEHKIENMNRQAQGQPQRIHPSKMKIIGKVSK